MFLNKFQHLTTMQSYRQCIELIFILAYMSELANCDVISSVFDKITEDPLDSVFDQIKCSCNRTNNLNVSQTMVIYQNYKSNTTARYFINEAADQILARSDFDPELCLNIFITGFNNGTPQEDVNCIFSQTKCNGRKIISLIIDHTYYTSDKSRLNIIELYEEVVVYIKPIGIAIGNFFLTLFQTIDLTNSSVNIVGHSIGAHMLGYAGEVIISNDKILPLAYGIDAAGPCFYDCPNEHFRSGQAGIVISMHSNSGQLGTSLRIADYDFISEDGVHQNGCGVGTASNPFCSHVIGVPIGLNPVIRDNIWISKKCSSYEKYKKGSCDNNETTLAGFTKVPETDFGIYYFSPNNLVCNTRANILLFGK